MTSPGLLWFTDAAEQKNRKEKNVMEQRREFRGISALTLHLLAMAFMLCDHLWATVLYPYDWLTWVGRLTYPIFAFLLVEGFYHTHDLKKYLLRMLAFAVISELPFNLMYSGQLIYPVHQNVMWTLLLSLLCMAAIEKTRRRGKWWLTAAVFLLTAGAGYVLGILTMVDYFGCGVLMVLVFYLFRGRKWWQMLGQALGLYWVNVELLGGMMVPVTVLGHTFMIVQQGTAVLALLFIWLYRGRQGPHSKAVQYACYAFYPVHLLILGLLGRYL